MSVTITAIYASICGLLLIALSLRVIRARRREHIGLGDGDNPALHRAIRVQANFSEYAPMVLILMGLAELQGTSDIRVHVIGVALIAGRLIHAFGVSQESESYRYRVTGMVLTPVPDLTHFQ